MPVIEIHLIEGYSADDRTRLSAAMTDALRMVVPAPEDAVVVMIHEMNAKSYMRGRTHRTPAPALPSASSIVRDYLSAMEQRDLDRAKSFLGQGFTMVFPGAETLATLEELIAWSRPRYNCVAKDYVGFDEAKGPDDVTVVYCRGTLRGEWPDGTKFDSIRFIDRFEVSGGKIVKQDVWNDLAEVKAQT